MWRSLQWALQMDCKWNIYTPPSVQCFPCAQQTLIDKLFCLHQPWSAVLVLMIRCYVHNYRYYTTVSLCFMHINLFIISWLYMQKCLYVMTVCCQCAHHRQQFPLELSSLPFDQNLPKHMILLVWTSLHVVSNDMITKFKLQAEFPTLKNFIKQDLTL